MADSAPSTADLTALLERLSLQPAGTRAPSEVSQAQLDLVLARMNALIALLREAAPSDTARLAERLLLADLAFVAARFRAEANAASASLERTLDGVREVVDRVGPTDPA